MRSLFRYVPGCFLLVFATISASTWADNDYQCTNIYDKLAKRKVYLISMLQSEMLIITKDFPPLVYEVPANKVTKDSVDMYQVMPESMDKKWFVIFNDLTYRIMAKLLSTGQSDQTSFTIKLDKELILFNIGSAGSDAYFYLETLTCTLDPVGISAVNYEVKVSYDSFQHVRLHIPSDEPNVLYHMWAYPASSFHLYKYVYRQNAFWTEWSVDMCLSFEQGTPTMAFYQMGFNCSQFNWTIAFAFAYQGHFYMFDTNHVYIFHYQSGSIVDTKEIVTIVAFDNYLQCIEPTTVPSLSSTPSMDFPSTTPTNHFNATLFNSTGFNTEDLLDAMPKPLEIAAITLSLILIFVLVSICVCQVLTSEDEDQSVPNLKYSFKSRVYGPKASMN